MISLNPPVKNTLVEKLIRLSIKKKELDTLLGQLGFERKSGKGSHEKWLKESFPPIILATHDKEVKPYQLRQVIKILQEGGLI